MNRHEAEQWYQQELERAMGHNASVRAMTATWDAQDKQAWMIALRREWDRRLGDRESFDEKDLENAWQYAIQEADETMEDHFEAKRDEARANAKYGRDR